MGKIGEFEFYGFKTVDSLPLLYLPSKDLLVLSDLHLGLEENMTSKGSYVPQFQLEDIIEDINFAKKLTNADKILINGDLKNEFSRSHFAEKKEIRELINELEQNFDQIFLIKGNHDTAMDKLLEEFNVEFADYKVLDNILFTHGHKLVENLEGLSVGDFDTIVLGHEHPALSLVDDVGVKEKVDCFLYGESDLGNLVVLPAFAKVSSGTRINETPSKNLLSPLLRNSVDVGELKALGVSREAGLFPFPELKKLKKR